MGNSEWAVRSAAGQMTVPQGRGGGKVVDSSQRAVGSIFAPYTLLPTHYSRGHSPMPLYYRTRHLNRTKPPSPGLRWSLISQRITSVDPSVEVVKFASRLLWALSATYSSRVIR